MLGVGYIEISGVILITVDRNYNLEVNLLSFIIMKTSTSTYSEGKHGVFLHDYSFLPGSWCHVILEFINPRNI